MLAQDTIIKNGMVRTNDSIMECPYCKSTFQKDHVRTRMRKWGKDSFYSTRHCPNCDKRITLRDDNPDIESVNTRLSKLRTYCNYCKMNGQFDDYRDAMSEILELQKQIEDMRNGEMKSKVKDATNYNGERTFQTYEAWKRACRQIDPNVKFDGDKDICQAGKVGEWDGAKGIIYNTKDRKTKDAMIKYKGFSIVEDMNDHFMVLKDVGKYYTIEQSLEAAKDWIDDYLKQTGQSTDSKKLMKDAASVALRRLGRVKKQIKDRKTTDQDNIKEKLIAFFKANPNPDDDKVHAFAEQNGIDPHELEEEIYKLVTEHVGMVKDNLSQEEAIERIKYLERIREQYKSAGNQVEVDRINKEIDTVFNTAAFGKDFKTKDASSEYIQGYTAARGAYHKGTNPIKNDPAKAAEWDRGWEDGKADKDELSAKGSGQEYIKYGSHFKDKKTKDEDSVVVSPSTGGWDISVFIKGQKVKTAWKYDKLLAFQAARDLADFYRDDNGQSLNMIVNDSKPTAKDKLLKGLDSLKRKVKDAFGMNIEEKQKQFDVRNIEEESIKNNAFRRVIFTGNTLQLVLMSLLPNEDIGMEVHDKVDQFFRVEEGEGLLEVEGQGTQPLQSGSSILITAGTKHNVKNIGDKPLKLYTIYGPPNHPADTLQNTKAEAVAAEKTAVGDRKTKDASPADSIKNLLQKGYSLKEAILETEKSIGRQLNAFEAAEAVAVSKKMGKTKDVNPPSESERIKNDFESGRKDHNSGYYDKWYRWNRKDNGRAYDDGFNSVAGKPVQIIEAMHDSKTKDKVINYRGQMIDVGAGSMGDWSSICSIPKNPTNPIMAWGKTEQEAIENIKPKIDKVLSSQTKDAAKLALDSLAKLRK